jgi:hypothetical protein
MRYTEEKSFTVRVDLVAEFPDDYEGELDGYEWHAQWDRTVRPALVDAVLRALAVKGWRVTPVSRGASASEVLEVRVSPESL